MMAAGAVLTQVLPMKEWGIKTLDAVAPGLPKWSFPNLMLVSMDEVVTISLSVAVVIMAETLLAENNFAQKNGYRINDNQELLSFAVGNLVAALTGCCPINGSVSRTAMGEQYQENTVNEYCCRIIYDPSTVIWNRIYWISSSSGIDGDRNFRTSGSDRI